MNFKDFENADLIKTIKEYFAGPRHKSDSCKMKRARREIVMA